MGGELSLDEYTRYLAQLAWVYEALEERGSRDGDPAGVRPRPGAHGRDRGRPGRARRSRLARPPSRRCPRRPAYAAHLRAISDDDVRYLAHHYTRYLGDLSGGQAIAALVARHYGATPDQLGFYRFEIADDGIVRYKRGYREAMNALALSPDEVDVLIDEVRTSFRMNSAIFEALAD